MSALVEYWSSNKEVMASRAGLFLCFLMSKFLGHCTGNATSLPTQMTRITGYLIHLSAISAEPYFLLLEKIGVISIKNLGSIFDSCLSSSAVGYH